MRWDESVDVDGHTLKVSIDYVDEVAQEVGVSVVHQPNGTHRVEIVISGDQPATVSTVTVAATVSTANCRGVYIGADPHLEFGYLPHWPIAKEVSAHRGVPIAALVDHNAMALFAMGLLDQDSDAIVHAQLSEMDQCYHLAIERPPGSRIDGSAVATTVPAGHTEVVYVLTRPHEFPQLLADYAECATAHTGIAPRPVPAHAFLPVYCTWTAVHHEVNHEWAAHTARTAYNLGFRTWITDDGWHHPNGTFGSYSDIGHWQPDPTKFPDFSAHVREIQSLGMAYMLWVAPFMLGSEQTRYPAGAVSTQPGHPGAAFDLIDPEDPQAAEHVVTLLAGLVRQYGLDGLKIDFLDSLSARRHGNFTAPVGPLVRDILHDALDPLLATNPDLLIEFRNNYANLSMTRFATHYRSSDLPVNYVLNRWQATFLRLLSPHLAVVTDPMLWPPNDSDINVSIHLINGLMAVPMVSIDFAQYPESHLAIIKHWMGYYTDNIDVLAHGQFAPTLRGSTIPVTICERDNHAIMAVFDDVPVSIPPAARVDILNASPTEDITIVSIPSSSPNVTIVNHFGQVIESTTWSDMPRRMMVPRGGRIELRDSIKTQ